MDSKLPLDTFEAVLALAMDGCKAIAAHMRQVRGADFCNLLCDYCYIYSLLPSVLRREICLEEGRQALLYRTVRSFCFCPDACRWNGLDRTERFLPPFAWSYLDLVERIGSAILLLLRRHWGCVPRLFVSGWFRRGPERQAALVAQAALFAALDSKTCA